MSFLSQKASATSGAVVQQELAEEVQAWEVRCGRKALAGEVRGYG
jgi:DNA-binding transcriptional regulator YdaS (Cro superfamily)